MAVKWIELGRKNLESGDTIERTYPGIYSKKSGYVLMSKRKLMFVSEEGLFGKKYNLLMDIPYNKLKENSAKGTYKLELTEVDGKKHELTFDFNVSRIQKSLEELMPSAKA